MLNYLMKQGYSMIIGDVVTWEIAKKIGMSSVLLTSGTECVRNAFDEAVKIHEYLEKSTDDLPLTLPGFRI
ncbi:MAG: PrpR N-terminal domain-containing protein [Bacillota bacterium]